MVEFYNCDLGILETLRERWGGKIKSRQGQPHHNVSYTLSLNTTKSLQILDEIVDLMLHVKKKKRAQLIVDHYRDYTPRNGKYTIEQLKKKKWLEEAVMSIKMRGK